MRKTLFVTIMLLWWHLGGFSQTAVNFNVPDCKGISFDLFSTLDAGKVVVIGWTMPCGSCVLPLKTTYNVVQSYQSTHPDMVMMLLCDDYADLPCSSLDLWANTYEMSNTRRFSNAAIKMTDYGLPGMPKVVVLGGSGHQVFYNAVDAVDHVALQQAIDAAISVISGVDEHQDSWAALALNPNPAVAGSDIMVELRSASKVKLSITDPSGRLVHVVAEADLNAGQHHFPLPALQGSGAVFLLRLQHEKGVVYRKFVNAHVE